MIKEICDTLPDGDVVVIVNGLDKADTVLYELSKIITSHSTLKDSRLLFGINNVYIKSIRASLKGLHPKLFIIDSNILINDNIVYFDVICNQINKENANIKFADMSELYG